MSPIIDLQLRLRQLGTLRMGELVSRGGKTFPSSRDTWRITTSDPKIADQVANQYGGTPTEWDSKSPEGLVVDTDVNALPIAVVPGHALSQWYELWSGGGCTRRCDGHEETFSGGECLCDPDNRECKPHTRLSVVVRGIDALGLFRLNTSGYYAAVELGGAVQFLEQRTARGETLEGWLRIEQRRSLRDGQTRQYKVPVLDVAYGLDRMLPTAPQVPELPAVSVLPNGYVPVPQLTATPVTLRQGLEQATTQTITRRPKGQAPLPVLEEDVPFGDGPVPVPTDQPELPLEDVQKRTGPQTKALNTLVGKLRKGGHITTEQLYAAISRSRDVDPDTMVELLGGRDADGLHWAPLRDSLTGPEASELIGRLERLEQAVKAAEVTSPADTIREALEEGT